MPRKRSPRFRASGFRGFFRGGASTEASGGGLPRSRVVDILPRSNRAIPVSAQAWREKGARKGRQKHGKWVGGRAGMGMRTWLDVGWHGLAGCWRQLTVVHARCGLTFGACLRNNAQHTPKTCVPGAGLVAGTDARKIPATLPLPHGPPCASCGVAEQMIEHYRRA